MAVLVIGGSGFIGSTVVQALTRKNIEAVSYDLIHTDVAGPQKSWIRADILEMQSIERVFFEYEIDAIVHLVGLPAIDQCQKNPHFSFLLNVMSVQNTLEAMRSADIRNIVFASSATVYGNNSEKLLSENDEPHPTTTYGWHKLIAEKTITSYAKTYGIHSTILRLFNVYGGNPKLGKEVISIFINRALRDQPLIVKGPEKFRDFVHIEDVAESITRAIQGNNKTNSIVNIGSGVKTTLKQLGSIVTSIFPKTKIIVEPATDDGTGLVANVRAAKESLGFVARSPRVGIADHIRKYAEARQEIP
ncbi:MAG TPA: NAD(P)-dependent oxidoreductase [Candidatus Dormibacteraeota bacterium]|jgi:nucleoside-diphosphate-sugar epimerase|nr:NAD(P)-dependent oxidoreductase [Candidatus Dormibacteraeota bacterium]